jgi:polyisoprenoid-binding protein YceI
MPRLHHALLAVALASSFTAVNAAPTTYNIVSKLSRVNFSLRHQGFIDLFGTLRLTPGRFIFDPQDWSRSSIQVSMPVASIDLGDAQWNNQVRGDSSWARLFMGADEISFRSTRLERGEGMQGRLFGDLTLAGVTRPIVLDLRFNKLGLNEVSEKPSVGFSARTTIKRSDYGLDAYLDLVGDEMAIQIQVEGTEGEDIDARNPINALGVKGKS